MNNIPLIRQLDPWRTVVSSLVALGFAFGLSAVAVAGLGWEVMGAPVGDALVIAFIVNVAHTTLLRMVAGRLLKDAREAIQAIGQGDYQRAIRLYQQHLALLQKYSWLERARTVLLLDQSRFAWTESVLVNIADCYLRLGDLDRASEYYQRTLAIHPQNVMALQGLNLLNLFTGKPCVPEYDLEYRYAYDPGQRSMKTWVPRIIVYVLAAVFVCPFSMLSLFIPSGSIVTLILPWLGFLVFLLAFPPIYRWAAVKLFLPDIDRGIQRFKQGAYAEAVEAFDRQYELLTLSPMVDRWRIVLLLDPGAYSYREWALLYQVMPYAHLGRRDKVITLYEECLKLNPDNVYARAGLELVRKLEAVTAGQAVEH